MHDTARRKKLLLLVVDVLILYVALVLALVLRFGAFPTRETWAIHLGPFSLSFAGWLAIFYLAGLYGFDVPFDGIAFAKRLLRSVAVAVLCTMALFYLFDDFYITPKTVLVIFAAVFTVLLYCWRVLFGRYVWNAVPRTRIGFVGCNEVVRDLVEAIGKTPRLGYVAAFVYDESSAATLHVGVPTIADPAGLVAAVRQGEASLLVLTEVPYRSEEIRNALFNLMPYDIGFRSLSDFYEIVLQRVSLDAINQAWFLDNIDLKSKQWYRAAKRVGDIALSLLVLAVTIPIWVVVAAIVKMESRGPVFFRQERLGRLSRPFRIIKFRTMYTVNNNFAPTGERDPRVTRFGSLLRKTRLDELPQFVNILRGDMCLIGPRPERPEIVAQLEQRVPFYRQRMLVPPGITGWDQVSGEYHSASVEDTFMKLQNDLYYIKNESLFLDLSIAARTIITILSRGGR